MMRRPLRSWHARHVDIGELLLYRSAVLRRPMPGSAMLDALGVAPPVAAGPAPGWRLSAPWQVPLIDDTSGASRSGATVVSTDPPAPLRTELNHSALPLPPPLPSSLPLPPPLADVRPPVIAPLASPPAVPTLLRSADVSAPPRAASPTSATLATVPPPAPERTSSAVPEPARVPADASLHSPEAPRSAPAAAATDAVPDRRDGPAVFPPVGPPEEAAPSLPPSLPARAARRPIDPASLDELSPTASAAAVRLDGPLAPPAAPVAAAEVAPPALARVPAAADAERASVPSPSDVAASSTLMAATDRASLTPVEERQSRRPPPRPRAGSPGVRPGGAALFESRGAGRSPEEWVAKLRHEFAEPAAPEQPAGPGAHAAGVPPALPQALPSPMPLVRPAVPATARVTSSPALPVFPSTARASRLQAAWPIAAAPAPALALSRAPAPDPVSQSVRHFLRPLVGVDPATVEVRRDPAARAFAEEQHADAVVRTDEVAIASAEPEREPASVALLAHELTHVARQRAPGFIPPIMRAASRAGALPSPPIGTAAPSRPTPPPVMAGAPAAEDVEEAVALDVESRVLRAATRHAAAPVTAGVPEAEDGERAVSRWNGLPAPWEPMPELPDGAAAPGGAPRAVSPLELAHGVGTPSALALAVATPVAAVQRAARDRRLESVAEPAAESIGGAAHPAADGAPGGPAPDVEALARQVYAVLRRRLSAERRRIG